jgi:hypothetical protein
MKTSIIESTKAFEAWLRLRISIVERDLALKHKEMADDVFQFMRATYYRWAEVWPSQCPKAAGALEVLAVGDLHVQNFGTWRDAHSRLAWGVNDFDEADRVAFANDLVRLCASVELAAGAIKGVVVSGESARKAALKGYLAQLDQGGQPFVLEERYGWLLSLAREALKRPQKFWDRWLNVKTVKLRENDVPESARAAIRSTLPRGSKLQFRVRSRAKPQGLGSLGRERYFAYGEWKGGPIAREAKAMAPPATQSHRDPPYTILLQTLLHRAERSPDPYYAIHDRWLVRPVAAEAGRIELGELKEEKVEERLIEAMGAETANIHLGSAGPKELAKALARLGKDAAWLDESVERMLRVTQRDFHAWQAHYRKREGSRGKNRRKAG